MGRYLSTPKGESGNVMFRMFWAHSSQGPKCGKDRLLPGDTLQRVDNPQGKAHLLTTTSLRGVVGERGGPQVADRVQGPGDLAPRAWQEWSCAFCRSIRPEGAVER